MNPEAREFQRRKQQGHGKPIISGEKDGARFVQVGKNLYRSTHKKWKTFGDFLSANLTRFFDAEWFEQEEKRPEAEHHPLLRWIALGEESMTRDSVPMGSLFVSPTSGALRCYYDLAYSLYLVEHNCGIPDLIVKRLRNRLQFHDVLHELWVAGWFIRAGFVLTHEDESDSGRSHCEFTAVHPVTGRSFSVEVKRQQKNNRPETVGRQLKSALAKDADFTRIIVIEANLAEGGDESDMMATMQRTLDGLREREIKEPFANRNADPAYVIVTNNPFEHHPSEVVKRRAIVEGYKIPDLKFDKPFRSIRDMVDSRDRHWELFDLMESLKTHDAIPVTFDGAIPELEFGKAHSPLIIGERYSFEGEDGNPLVGELQSAVVMGTTAMCIMRTPQGNMIVQCPLTEDEVTAYSHHPETFFGRIERGSEARDALDIFDQTVAVYKETPKEKLLEFMSGRPGLAGLQALSQPELVRLYAEGLTESIMRKPGMEGFGMFGFEQQRGKNGKGQEPSCASAPEE